MTLRIYYDPAFETDGERLTDDFYMEIEVEVVDGMIVIPPFEILSCESDYVS